MGRELLATEAPFREAVLAVDAEAGRYLDWSVAEVFREGSAEIDRTEVAQVAIFAMQTGLAALWKSWGVEPDAVIGHSVGEVAAAYVSLAAYALLIRSLEPMAAGTMSSSAPRLSLVPAVSRVVRQRRPRPSPISARSSRARRNRLPVHGVPRSGTRGRARGCAGAVRGLEAGPDDGGVGQAALRIAQSLGVEVLATAGSPSKRDWLRSQGVALVVDSRSVAFGQETQEATGGRGVDVVLNTLPPSTNPTSLETLRPRGRFVDISNIYSDAVLDLRAFQKGISATAFDLDQLMRSDPDFIAAQFAQAMRFVAERSLPPLTRSGFPLHRAGEAFRLMAKAQHIGKLVLIPEPAPHTPVDVSTVACQFRADATYLVTGGTSGFGLYTARWLADGGARHLALLSRSGRPRPEEESALAGLAARGATGAVIGCGRSESGGSGRGAAENRIEHAAAPRSGARRDGLCRSRGAETGCRLAAGGPAPQGFGRLAPAPADARIAARFLCALFVRSRASRKRGTGRLCGGEWISSTGWRNTGGGWGCRPSRWPWARLRWSARFRARSCWRRGFRIWGSRRCTRMTR